MASKPESNYIKRIHRLIPTVYAEKMHNMYRGGTADVFYSGMLGSLWVEYKFLPKIPSRPSTEILPDLSERQRKWLGDRFNDGRLVAVVVGTPEGGVLYRDCSWNTPITTTAFRELLLPNSDIAGWIQSRTGESPSCLYLGTPSTPAESSSRGTKSS